MGGERGAVGAAVCWKGEDGGCPVGGPLQLDQQARTNGIEIRWRMRESYDFDSAVPGAGAEGIFVDEVPVHREHFSLMLLP